MGLDCLHNLDEVLHVFGAIGATEHLLVLSQRVAPGIGNDALRIQHVDGLLGFLGGHAALELDVGGNALCHAHGRRSRPEKHHPCILQLGPLSLHAVDKPGGDYCARSLDVIIEAEHLLPHALQNGKCHISLEIFKLHARRGEPLFDSKAELLDDGQMLLPPDAVLLCPHVELVGAELGVVGAAVQYHRHAVLRVEAPTCDVELDLANRDPDAVGSQIAQAEDAAAIGDHNDLHSLGRPVTKDLLEAPPVLKG
mmetsp:Transcript_14810/g.44739  ORF Transcript_14810/g.44739 Transcript_14810/m.44739 type:complete len:253 (-) Transcript_14810:539-1297(-)